MGNITLWSPAYPGTPDSGGSQNDPKIDPFWTPLGPFLTPPGHSAALEPHLPRYPGFGGVPKRVDFGVFGTLPGNPLRRPKMAKTAILDILGQMGSGGVPDG